MSFAENVNRICKKQKTTLTALVKDMGFSSAKASAINKGSIPKEDDLTKMAKKLNCNVSDFFKTDHDLKLDLDEDEQDIIDVFRTLGRKAKHEFMSTVYSFGDKK